MRITLSEKYEPIESFTTEDLPDFAVLIGRNGAGKTQLLHALKDGWASVRGIDDIVIDVDDIVLHDMASFVPTNSSLAGRNPDDFAQTTADSYLIAPIGETSRREKAAAIFDQFTDNTEHGDGGRDAFERMVRDEIRQMPDFTMFMENVGLPIFPYREALYDQVLRELDTYAGSRGVIRQSRPAGGSNGNPAALLSQAMKLAGKLPHELTREEIIRASYYEGDTISNSLSTVFMNYKIEQYIWAHRQVETKNTPFKELIAEYVVENPPPWVTLRQILAEMREATGGESLFDFDFSDPDKYELHMGNYDTFSFKAELKNRSTDTQYELESLSSGEKILMALCLVSFNQYLGRRLPKLLLLDELDAVLHPSMVATLVRTLKALFVANGTKVLMTSHLPMTVAALEENDIFRVVRTGRHVDVSRTTKSEAIAELSEGLATIDVGLRIAASDKAKVTILTEGSNTKHLKRWVELNFPKDVRVFDELEAHTNDSQLLAYGRLLGRMDATTHFVIVWDCDAAEKAEMLRQELPNADKVTPFAFKRRPDNIITRRGIENLYDEKFLVPFTFEKINHDGVSLGRELPASRKGEFANHVLREGTVEYFTYFQDLHAIISRILDLPHRNETECLNLDIWLDSPTGPSITGPRRISTSRIQL